MIGMIKVYSSLLNNSAIRLAVKWYKNHVPVDYSVVLVTDDVENRVLSEREGLNAFSGNAK